MSTKIGLNIHNSLQGQDGKPRAYSAAEKNRRDEIIARLDSAGNLWMDDIDRARAEKKRYPHHIVVHRWYKPNDAHLYKAGPPKQVAEALYNEYAPSIGDSGVVLQLLNEPTGYGAQGSQDDLERIADFSAACQERFGGGGIGLALPCFGEGHPDEKRLAELAAHWESLKTWQALHFHTSHEYGTWRGMTYDDPEDKEDMFPWRVGRFMFTADYCQQRYGFIPNMLVAEWGIDSAHDGRPFRGWRTTSRTGKQYARELIACARNVYALAYIKALFVYCLGNTGERSTQDDWATFDVWGADDFFDELEADSMVNIPSAVPFPDNLGAPHPYILSAAVGEKVVNGRIGPGTVYPELLQVPDGAQVKVWREAAKEGQGRLWYPTEYNGRRFWLPQVGYNGDRSLRTFEQQFLVVLEPPVVVEPPPASPQKQTFVVELRLTNVSETDAATLASTLTDWLNATVKTLAALKLAGSEVQVAVKGA